MINILFVCMGNICRSPSAEGFFARELQNSEFRERVSIDSAGTHGYHVDHPPDPRAIETASTFGVDITQLRARRVNNNDFFEYDLIVAMDRSNYQDLLSRQPAGSKARVELMMSFHPDGHPQEVPDPYYGGMDGFRYMCELLQQASAGLLAHVGERLSRTGQDRLDS